MKHIHLLILALLLSGCATSKYTEEGIPKPEYKIGGGVAYIGVAQKSGTFLVVEENTKRIVVTYTVKKGQPIRYTLNEDRISEDPKGFEDDFGIPYSEAKFSVYLIP